MWGDQPMTARRLGVLLKGLPLDSATTRAIQMTPVDEPAPPTPRPFATDADIRAFGGKVTYSTKGAD